VGEYDECGVCNGDGIAEGTCDCDGNVIDDCGVCGGSGVDLDNDGICDDVDSCVGEYDECGVCNGDGIAEGTCDCDGNIEDCLGECGGGAIIDECGECNGDGSSCLDKFDINIPQEFYLSHSYPNPFNPQTTFNYGVPEPSYVTIRIYNSVGQMISSPISYFHLPGNYMYTWNASQYSNGIYYFQLMTKNISITRKTTLLK